VQLVSNMVTHSTRSVLTAPHISKCWPEDGLIGPQHVATVIVLRCIVNVSDRSSRANQNIHFIFNISFF